MVILNNIGSLIPGHLYYYEFENERAIGEYIEEWQKSDDPYDSDEEWDPCGVIERYIAEIWSEDALLSHTYLGNNEDDDLVIIKDLGNAYPKPDLDRLIEELKEEFPEYFI